MDLIWGIWLLDLLNLVKYNGFDVFDTVLNISSGNWCGIIIPIALIYIILGLMKAYNNKN